MVKGKIYRKPWFLPFNIEVFLWQILTFRRAWTRSESGTHSMRPWVFNVKPVDPSNKNGIGASKNLPC